VINALIPFLNLLSASFDVVFPVSVTLSRLSNLGMHVTCDCCSGWIALSQERYTLELLERFGKSDARPISTPTLENEHLAKVDSPKVDTQAYRRAVDPLMYLMLRDRTDLAYTVVALGRHHACPRIEHQRALDRAFRYLRATSDWKFVYQSARCPQWHYLEGIRRWPTVQRCKQSQVHVGLRLHACWGCPQLGIEEAERGCSLKHRGRVHHRRPCC